MNSEDSPSVVFHAPMMRILCLSHFRKGFMVLENSKKYAEAVRGRSCKEFQRDCRYFLEQAVTDMIDNYQGRIIHTLLEVPRISSTIIHFPYSLNKQHFIYNISHTQEIFIGSKFLYFIFLILLSLMHLDEVEGHTLLRQKGILRSNTQLPYNHNCFYFLYTVVYITYLFH